MTLNTYWNPDNPRVPAEIERALSKARVISVLCVHENPVFLDRVCRHLEQRGDLSVDISVSAEDALHLMQYVPFDVVVADCTPGQGTPGLLKAIRDRQNPVPIICFSRERHAESEAEARRYGAAAFIAWGEASLSRGFEELYHSVKRAAAAYRKKN